MSTIELIIDFLIGISGICCAFLITKTILNMIYSQEESSIYRKKLINGIIAFILILCIIPIKSIITTKYFSEDNLNIGTVPDDITLNPINDITANDRDGRDTFKYNNQVYVITDKSKAFFLKIDSKYQPVYYLWVAQPFNECQGITRGAFNSKKYFLLLIGNEIFMLDCSTINVASLGNGYTIDREIFNYMRASLTKITNINYGTYDYVTSSLTLVNYTNSGGGGAF